MLKEKISVAVFTVLLMSIAILVFNIQPVKAEPTTWIVDDDGPADFSRIQEAVNIAIEGDTIYVRNGTYCENVIVNKSNLTLIGENKNTTVIDGNGTSSALYVLSANNIKVTGFTITSPGANSFDLSYSNGSMIVDNNLIDSAQGIQLSNSDGNIVRDNYITGTGTWGIRLYDSSNNTLINNQLINNDCGICLDYSSNNTLTGNEITANDIGISLGGSPQNIIRENIVTNSSNIGIYLFKTADYKRSDFTIITENLLIGNYRGIYVYWSHDNSIVENVVMNNTYGVYLDQSDRNTIRGQIVKYNDYGIRLYFSWATMIEGNMIDENEYGMHFVDSSYGTISGNIMTSNDYGTYLSHSGGKSVFHNNLVNNTMQVYNHDSVNIWYDSYIYEGNYWSNYTGVDDNKDGIGDSPHVIDSSNQDPYPLMGIFSNFNTSSGNVYTICNSTISNFQFYYDSENQTNVIKFNVNGTEGSGFCRICIPHAILNETYTVLVDGHEPDYANYTLYDNGTYRWIYFTYQYSIHEVVIIPEFPSFLILPLFLITTLLVVIIYKRKHPPR